MSDVVRERSIILNDFSGGLNNYWDPSSISNNEVPFLQNMEFTPNGALTSRPPILDSGLALPVANEYVDILGYYTPPSGDVYMLATTNSKTWAVKVLPWTTTWIQIWDSKASDFVQYSDQIFLCKEGSAGGARWMPSRPAASTPANPVIDGSTDTIAIAGMPALSALEVFRERMFGAGPSNTSKETAIYWSDIISTDAPTGIFTWHVDSIIYVGRGDGQYITALVADYNGIIIFKHASTYTFSYSDLPEEGTVSLVQYGIGAENKDCVASYQNGFVVLHDRTLYKFQNNLYAPINAQKVRFEYSNEEGTYKKTQAVSIIGDRAIVWTFGNCYTLNLQTGTWAQWLSATRFAWVKELRHARADFTQNARGYGVTGSSVTGRWKIYKIQDSPITTEGSESFECILRTKIYDFDTPTEWKRLYWWAADVSANNNIKGSVVGIGLSEQEGSWDQMDQYTWDYFETRDWDHLFIQGVQLNTNQTVSGEFPQRVSLKMDKSIRFRRAYFEVYLNCDGTENTAPAQIFSLTPMVGTKAKMTKDVS